MFNKRTLLVEETIHVLFDEVIENHKERGQERDLDEEKNLLKDNLNELNLKDSNI